MQTLPSALSIAASNDGAVYVGGANGLYRVGDDAKASEVWPATESHGLVQVHAIVQDHRGRLWLAVFGAGLTVYDPADGSAQSLHHEIGMPGSLPDDYVTHLLIDRSGLLWVGGDLAGVSTTDPDGAQFRYVMDSSPARNQMTNDVRSILDNGGGGLWLGTDGDGLKRYDAARGAFEYFDDVFKVVPTVRRRSELARAVARQRRRRQDVGGDQSRRVSVRSGHAPRDRAAGRSERRRTVC